MATITFTYEEKMAYLMKVLMDGHTFKDDPIAKQLTEEDSDVSTTTNTTSEV